MDNGTRAAKSAICVVLALLTLALCLNGCQPAQNRSITCEDIIAAYEEAGYEVFHADTQENEYACWVKASENGEDIYFHFFDSAEAAEQYAQDQEWNLILWLYSMAIGQPFWLTTKTYGNIEYEYASNTVAKPFQALIQ